MSKMVDVDYTDLGGGRNGDAAPAGISRREFQELKNWYPYDTKLRRRGGVKKLTGGGAFPAGEITGMHPLKKRDGSWQLVVGGVGAFGRLDGNEVVMYTPPSSLQIASSQYPWVFFQYKDYLYAVRKGGNGKMFRLGTTSVRHAGLEAPTTGPTLAEDGAGDLTAGDYRAVTTFYNRETAYESNPGPEGNVLTLAASKKIDYSAIPTSTNPFFNARRVYRTLPDQKDVYFFVFQLDDMTTTTFTGENTVVSQLGRTVSFKNGLPPDDIRVATTWLERVFASDGRDLFYSEILQGEGFGSDNILPVFPDDGHEIRALHPLADRLIIGKTNKIHYLVGTSETSFGLHTLSDEHGCMSGHSMKSAEGMLFWYGSGKAVYKSQGTGAVDITTPRIKDLLKEINDDREEFIVGATFPKYNWYVLSIPQGARSGTEPNRIVLVYNYRSDAWTTFTHPSDAPQFLGMFFSELGAQSMYATFYDGHIYNYNDESWGYDFDNNSIAAEFVMPPDDFGVPGTRKSMEQVWFLIPRVVEPASMQLTVFRDEGEVALNRSVSLNVQNSAWKPYKLGTHGKPGTKLWLKGVYTGVEAIDLDQIHVKARISSRRPLQPR